VPKDAKAILAAALLIAAGSMAAFAAVADEPADAATGNKLKSGLSPTVQLLQLMDTDKNGKVSKEELLRFMEAEFDLTDKNKDGELDPKELQHLQFFISSCQRPGPVADRMRVIGVIFLKWSE
jgi:EF hand domain-containing protein